MQLARAHLSCPAITASSDGTTTLTLAGLARGSTVLSGTTVVATASAARTATVVLAGGTTTLQVHCALAAQSHPPVSSSGPAVTAPGGALAATGLGGALPWRR